MSCDKSIHQINIVNQLLPAIITGTLAWPRSVTDSGRQTALLVFELAEAIYEEGRLRGYFPHPFDPVSKQPNRQV